MKKWFTQLFIIALMGWSGAASAQTVLANFDFDGDLQGWTSNTVSLDSVWQWSPDGDASRGAFGPPVTLNSPTIANGCARFDSDFYLTQGNPANAPGQPYPQFICELISPDIDLSGVTGPVSLRFSQVMRPLNLSAGAAARTGFQVSNDGGATWSATVDANESVPVNARENELQNGTVTFPVSGLAGSSNVKIKFIYAMDFYFWMIDDVQLIERQGLDMRSNGNFYAIPHNAQTPAAQVIDIRFLNDIENIGGAVAEDVVLTASIRNSGGTEVYTEPLNYGTIGLDSIAENVIFPGSYTPPAMAETYTGAYTVTSSGTDNDPDNNSTEYSFEVTENLYAKDLGATRSVAASADNSFSYGNHYICADGQWRADKVYFGLTFNAADRPAAAGKTVVVYLYEWDDANADGQSQMSERVTRGIAIYDITGNEDWRADPLIEVQLDPWDEPTDLTLEEGKDYIVTLEFDDRSGTPATCFYASADNIDYSAMVFLHDSINEPRYAGMLDVGLTGELGSLGFGRDLVPVCQLSILPPLNTDDIELADNALTLFPNPASHIMNVEVTLDEVAEDVIFAIYTMDGKTVFSDQKDNVQNNTFEYNVSNLPNGNYTFHMTIDGAYKMKQFTVAK